jgi:hypothetical protein
VIAPTWQKTVSAVVDCMDRAVDLAARADTFGWPTTSAPLRSTTQTGIVVRNAALVVASSH